MHHESMPRFLERAQAVLPGGVPPETVALLVQQARSRALARGLPPTARVVLKMLADLRVDEQGRPHPRF